MSYHKFDKELLEKIKGVIGKPYKYNCFDGTGFDCYTLVYYLYSLIGRQLPKENIAVYNLRQHKQLINKYKKQFFKPIPFENRQPFDIILMQSSDTVDAHIGMVLDRKHFIHVNFDHTVKIEPFGHSINSGQIKRTYTWNCTKS